MSKDLMLKSTKSRFRAICGFHLDGKIEATPEAIMRAFAEKYSLVLETGDVMLIGKNRLYHQNRISPIECHGSESQRRCLKSQCRPVMPKRVEIDYSRRGIRGDGMYVNTSDNPPIYNG